jgi:hypothetical protein
MRCTALHGGKGWSAPQKAPIDAPGALWSPVLHYDTVHAKLWLLYSESRICRHPNPPNNWAPGGDIKAVTLSKIGPNGAGIWDKPRMILAQSQYGVPNVIANKLLVTVRPGGYSHYSPRHRMPRHDYSPRHWMPIKARNEESHSMLMTWRSRFALDPGRRLAESGCFLTGGSGQTRRLASPCLLRSLGAKAPKPV